MKGRSRRNQNNKRSMFIWAAAAVTSVAFIGAAIGAAGFIRKRMMVKKPDELLSSYMAHVSEKEYEEMYAMIDIEASEDITEEEFVKRNSAIYEGIEVQNMAVEITEYDKKSSRVKYKASFDTCAGNISFENEAFFKKEKEGYKLIWQDYLIFPDLERDDKVRVSETQAERGEILDRNDRVLAGEGTASSVGIVPGKLQDKDDAIGKIGELLDVDPESIRNKLSAGWVNDDSFVPVKTIPKVEEQKSMSAEPDEKTAKEQERQEKLLKIPGVMISDTQSRQYPLGNAAAHLIGYVQAVTAEDLEEHKGEGYTAESVIGKNGMEGLFENELKGQNGCRIYIADAEGNEKAELADIPVKNGQNVKLTIDADLQTSLYERFREDKSCSAAMNPYTGEVLALVSTPSFDDNDFIMGISDGQWNALNENADKPLYNRFRQAWCPGSVFKPITAAIGLKSGAIDADKDYGNEGLSWQKDESWGDYYVTTLHEYEPVNLENALIYSDNIYFAKAALTIGSEEMQNSLKRLGFHDELPFEIKMEKSQYSNTENIETEIQLADSGYGQGQVLVNPLHMAAIYTAFCNDGSVVKPYLTYKQEKRTDYWIPDMFSADTAGKVLAGIKKAVNQPDGTGYAAHMEDVALAGKTGTAEIKAAKDDTSGTELGWFAVFTVGNTVKKPIILVSMAEDIKEKGGSGYVVEKDRNVLEDWFYHD